MDKCVTPETASLICRTGKFRLYDFGKDAFGELQLKISSPVPGSLTFAAGECLKDGLLDPEPGGFRRYFSDTVEFAAGEHLLDMTFPPHRSNPALKKCLPPNGREIMPFRYVQLPDDDTVTQVIRLAYYGGFNDDAAMFESSDPALDQVWEFCKYSIKATNVFSCYVDGDRERLPYEGDAYINQLGHFCCDAAYTKARNTIDHLLKYPTWPIEWRLLMPVIVRDYWLYSGDDSRLEAWEKPLHDSLFLDRLDNYGLLPEHFDEVCNGEKIRTIVDWPLPERDNCEFGSPMTVPNCYLHEALLAMAELYQKASYLALAAQVKTAVHQHLKSDGIFVDCSGSRHSSIHSLAFPVAFNVADPADIPRLIPAIAARNMPCSVYAAQFVLDALFIGKDPVSAIRLMTRNNDRSWLGMIAQGSTISMEAWNNAAKPNQDWNHAWGAAPANVIPRRLCGIRPLAPGFKKFIVAPQPGDLQFFRYRQPTPAGPVTVAYHQDSGTVVTLPDGKSLYMTEAEQIFEL